MLSRSILTLLLAGALWGSEWIVTPLLQQVAGPYTAFALTSGLAAVALGVVSLFTRAPHERISLRTTLVLALSLLGIPFALSICAGEHAVAGWPLLLFSVQPLLLGIALSRWSPAMALAPGAVLILLNGSIVFSLGKLPWLLLSFAAMSLQAWAFHYAARHLRGFSAGVTLRSVAVATAAATVLLAVAGGLFDRAPRIAPWTQWQQMHLFSFAIVAFFATAIPYALLWRVFAVGRLAADQVATLQWMQTLTALLEGAWFAHARPSWLMLSALALLAACIAIELRRRPVEGSIALFDSHAARQREKQT